MHGGQSSTPALAQILELLCGTGASNGIPGPVREGRWAEELDVETQGLPLVV
jgi:hypothetical protein